MKDGKWEGWDGRIEYILRFSFELSGSLLRGLRCFCEHHFLLADRRVGRLVVWVLFRGFCYPFPPRGVWSAVSLHGRGKGMDDLTAVRTRQSSGVR